MKLRFCIAKVRTRNHCNIYVCIGSGSSVSRAGWQISYAAIAIWGGMAWSQAMWAWRPLFRVRVVFFATFPERSRPRPRQTTEPFRKELKNATIDIVLIEVSEELAVDLV